MQTVCGSGKALTATARRTGKIENFISFTANERISWYVCIVGRGKRTRQTDGMGRIVIRGKSWVLLSALKHRLVKSLPKRQANVDFPFHLSLPRSDCANDRHPTCSPVSGLLTSNGSVEVSKLRQQDDNIHQPFRCFSIELSYVGKHVSVSLFPWLS